MRKSLAAIALCLSASVAGAHGVTGVVKKNAMNVTTAAAPAGPAAPAPGPGPEFIRSTNAHADAQHDLPMDDAPPVLRQGNPELNAGEQRPRGATPAMLLAIVAVMTGMVLRGYGTHMR